MRPIIPTKTIVDPNPQGLNSTLTPTSLPIPQPCQPLRPGPSDPSTRQQALRLSLGVLAHLAAENVGHVFQRGGLVRGGDEEPDEDECEGVKAGEEAEEPAVAPVDAEGDEEGENAGAGEVPEGGPGHADFAAFVGENLVIKREAGCKVSCCTRVQKERAIDEEMEE